MVWSLIRNGADIHSKSCSSRDGSALITVYKMLRDCKRTSSMEHCLYSYLALMTDYRILLLLLHCMESYGSEMFWFKPILRGQSPNLLTNRHCPDKQANTDDIGTFLKKTVQQFLTTVKPLKHLCRLRILRLAKGHHRVLQRNLPPGLTSYMRLEDLLWELWRQQMPNCYRSATPSTWQPDWVKEEREFQPVHPMENPCACFAPPYRWYRVSYWLLYKHTHKTQSISLVLPYYISSWLTSVPIILLVELQKCYKLCCDQSSVKNWDIWIILPFKTYTAMLLVQPHGHFESLYLWVYEQPKQYNLLIQLETCYKFSYWLIQNILFSQPYR